MGTNFTDNALLKEWYRYAATQEGFVGYWLQMLREQQKITFERQQKEFGVNNQDFVRLQGMPLPRPNQFTKDARQIAEACHLANPSKFVQAMLLARSLGRNESQEPVASQFVLGHSYQAAYDVDEDLDKSSDENEDEK